MNVQKRTATNKLTFKINTQEMYTSRSIADLVCRNSGGERYSPAFVQPVTFGPILLEVGKIQSTSQCYYCGPKVTNLPTSKSYGPKVTGGTNVGLHVSPRYSCGPNLLFSRILPEHQLIKTEKMKTIEQEINFIPYHE